ncbi:MAG: hypothetical protein Q7S63_03020 [bacterium]|nr:hypothetical protein [bacterium]
MKEKKRREAQNLRAQGWSINKIYRNLSVSKSSVSLWVRNIELSNAQKEQIEKGRFSREVIEKTRITRLQNENARRQRIIDGARSEINNITSENLFLIGIALYWGEGRKTGGVVQFSNSDPRLIQIMMRFFRETCKIPNEQFRGHIHIHPHLDHKKAEKYWSKTSGIPLKQFYKTYRIPPKSSKNKKDSLPFGTFDIYICKKELLLKIKGWTEGMYTAILQK